MSDVQTHKQSLLRAEDRRRLNCQYCEVSSGDADAKQKIFTGVESLLQHCQRKHPNQDVLHGSVNEEPPVLVACSYCEQEFGSLKSYTNHRAKIYDANCKAASPVEFENPFFNKPLAPLTMPSRNTPRKKRNAPPPIASTHESLPARPAQLPDWIDTTDPESECAQLADALVRMSKPDLPGSRGSSPVQAVAVAAVEAAANINAEVPAKKRLLSQPPAAAASTDSFPLAALQRIQAVSRASALPAPTPTPLAPSAANQSTAVMHTKQASKRAPSDATQSTASTQNALMAALSEYAGDDLSKWQECLKMVGVTDLAKALHMQYGFKRLLLDGPSCVQYAPIVNAISELRIKELCEENAALRRSRAH